MLLKILFWEGKKMSKASQQGIPIIRNTWFGETQEWYGLIGIPVQSEGVYVPGGEITQVMTVMITDNLVTTRIRCCPGLPIPVDLDEETLKRPPTKKILANIPPDKLEQFMRNGRGIEFNKKDIGR